MNGSKIAPFSDLTWPALVHFFFFFFVSSIKFDYRTFHWLRRELFNQGENCKRIKKVRSATQYSASQVTQLNYG